VSSQARVFKKSYDVHHWRVPDADFIIAPTQHQDRMKWKNVKKEK
jgi:hypothetical protein